jgi:hypothetical protein
MLCSVVKGISGAVFGELMVRFSGLFFCIEEFELRIRWSGMTKNYGPRNGEPDMLDMKVETL